MLIPIELADFDKMLCYTSDDAVVGVIVLMYDRFGDTTENHRDAVSALVEFPMAFITVDLTMFRPTIH